MKKYILTEVSKEFSWIKLFQIKALISFGVVSEWEIWWYIEKESNLNMSGDAWVSGDAQVSGYARVYGDARVSGNAQVSGYAWVSGDAQVSGEARVSW